MLVLGVIGVIVNVAVFVKAGDCKLTVISAILAIFLGGIAVKGYRRLTNRDDG